MNDVGGVMFMFDDSGRRRRMMMSLVVVFSFGMKNIYCNLLFCTQSMVQEKDFAKFRTASLRNTGLGGCVGGLGVW